MSVGKITLICLAGLALNLISSTAAKFFNLPIYLDTIGTIYIAALGGYVPGIAVGFFTNLIKAAFTPSEMYYSSVSVLIAIFTTYVARKGFFQNFVNVLLFIPALAVFTGVCSLIIESFVRLPNFSNSAGEFGMYFLTNIVLFELLDKGVSVLIAFALMQFTSQEIKNSFHLLGLKQAPLSDDMKRIISKQSYLSSSLRTKMLLILILCSLFVSLSIATISYMLFKTAAIDDKIKSVDGLIAVAINDIKADRIDDYLKLGYAAPDYRAVEQKLYAIKNSSLAMRYLYVYRIEADGCHVVFDLNSSDIVGDEPGQIVPLEKGMQKYRTDLIAGRPVPPIVTNDEYGYLLTLYKPMYDYNGKCQCYVAIDYSMQHMSEYLHDFVVKMIALFIGCFVFIFAIGFSFIENNIILPVNTMAYCAKNFSYDDSVARTHNVKLIHGLKIRTGDEIENLYQALLRTTKNILRYVENLQVAKTEVAGMKLRVHAMNNLARNDAMTGVKNKTAYNEDIAKLNEKIYNSTANFCIVMVDVNFLKRINDTYGHEHGNDYLINACRLVCAVFGEEHVYRIGGDEFVVILEGDKVSLCKYFATQFKSEMDRKFNNESLQPWEKISAAIGVATYEAGVDKTADEVFKRADAQMYANKLAMKANRRD